MSLGARLYTRLSLANRGVGPIFTTVVTNVPGPQFPMYMAGARAGLWLGAGCPLDGTGLFHTINSYYGSVCLAFICCREMMPDPDFYHQCITGAYHELLEAAQAIEAKAANSPRGKVEAAPKPKARKARSA